MARKWPVDQACQLLAEAGACVDARLWIGKQASIDEAWEFLADGYREWFLAATLSFEEAQGHRTRMSQAIDGTSGLTSAEVIAEIDPHEMLDRLRANLDRRTKRNEEHAGFLGKGGRTL